MQHPVDHFPIKYNLHERASSAACSRATGFFTVAQAEAPYIAGYSGSERFGVDGDEQARVAAFYEATAWRHAWDGWRAGGGPAVVYWLPFRPAFGTLRLISFARALRVIDCAPRIKTARMPAERLRTITQHRTLGEIEAWHWALVPDGKGVYVAASDLLLAILARADQGCLSLPDSSQHRLEFWRLLLPFAKPRTIKRR